MIYGILLQIFLILNLISTAEYLSAAKDLLATYTRVVGTDHTTNPNVGGAWTNAQLDALETLVETV